MDVKSLEKNTGELFSDLWWKYDGELFEASVKLFEERIRLSGFGAEWFKGKACLDAGCGGGRNSIAMARLGAQSVVGMDIGAKGLEDARRRAKGMANVRFESGSILNIPFPAETFDLVWCAGVLMITGDEEKALDELARVTRSGGYLYLLVYASGGMRWPLIQLLRPLAARLGKDTMEKAIKISGIPANKRRTFLDDLYCPALDFYHAERLQRMLRQRGFQDQQRWGVACRLDHEASLADYRADLESLGEIFKAGKSGPFAAEELALFSAASGATSATIAGIQALEQQVAKGLLSNEAAMDLAIGQGHHRIMARKG